jgi:tRNA 2-thiouridine synthesizing protein A
MGMMQQSDLGIPEQIMSYVKGESLLVDARRLRCPLPILKLARSYKLSPQVAYLILCATDDAVRIDVPAFCKERQFQLAAMHTHGVYHWFVINVE